MVIVIKPVLWIQVHRIRIRIQAYVINSEKFKINFRKAIFCSNKKIWNYKNLWHWKIFVVSWVSEWWINVFNVTNIVSNLSYIFRCGSVFGRQIRIQRCPEYGFGSTTLDSTSISISADELSNRTVDSYQYVYWDWVSILECSQGLKIIFFTPIMKNNYCLASYRAAAKPAESQRWSRVRPMY